MMWNAGDEYANDAGKEGGGGGRRRREGGGYYTLHEGRQMERGGERKVESGKQEGKAKTDDTTK